MRRLLSHGLHDGDCPAIFQDIKSVCLSKSHEEKNSWLVLSNMAFMTSISYTLWL
jgi:hypothetical protein